MENKTKILTFAAVALMFAVCFIGFVATNDDVVDADGGTGAGEGATNNGPLGDMCPEGMTYADGKYTLTKDVTVILTKDVSMNDVKFVGKYTLTITSEDKKHCTLTVNYDFKSTPFDKAGDIFEVSALNLNGADLIIVQSDTARTEGPGPKEAGASVFGTANVIVKNTSTMTITTNEFANRVFYNNGSSLKIDGPTAKVILERASSSTVSLSMTDGATLEIKNPLKTAGNFYPNINNTGKECKITVTGAADGNHGLFFYGTNSNAKDATNGVIKNCVVKSDGIVGFYSNGSVDATGSTFEAKKLVVAKSSVANMANVANATFIVSEIGALNPNDDYRPDNDKKLYLNGMTSVKSFIDEDGIIVNNGTIVVRDAAGLKTAVAAGGKISLANDIEITDHDSTINGNGLKITKCVNITGNGYTIKFSGEGTIYGFVFSNGCNGSTLSNVSLDFGKIAKYGLCIRKMSEGNDGITIENVTIDNYGKTGIDLNGVYGKIKLKNVDVKGNGHYVNTDTNLTRGHGYALVIDDIKDGANVTTENCTITSVNVHNFCGKIHSVDLSGCNGLLFVSVEDGSTQRTSVYDKGDSVSHNKQNGSLESIIGENGLLKDNIVTFPVGFNEKKYAIFDTVNDEDKKEKINGGSFEVLRAYRVCYGMAFFDANVKIVKDYTINCDAIIPDNVTVTIGESGKLIISDGVKLYNKGTINTTATDKLDVKGKLVMKAGSTLTVGSAKIIGAGAFDLKTGELEINTNSKGGFDAVLSNGKATSTDFVVWTKDTFTVAKGANLEVTGTFTNAGKVTIDGILGLSKEGKLQLKNDGTKTVGIITVNGFIAGGEINIADVKEKIKCIIVNADGSLSTTIDGGDLKAVSKVVLDKIVAGMNGITVAKGSVIVDGVIRAGDVTIPAGSTSFVYGTLESGSTLTIEPTASVNPETPGHSGTLVVESGASVVSDGAIVSVIYKAGSSYNGEEFTKDTKITPSGEVKVSIKIYLNYDSNKLRVSAHYIDAFAGDKYGDLLSDVYVEGVNKRITFTGWYNTLNEKITSSATVPDVAGDVELFAHFDEVAKQIPAKVDSDNGNGVNDYSLVIAIIVLVASIGFLACVIKKR